MSNDCQSDHKLLKSSYDKVNYKSIIEDENKLCFYTGIPTVAMFHFVENSVNQSPLANY